MKSLDISSKNPSHSPLIIAIIMMTVLFIDFYLSTIANIIVPFSESFYGLSIFLIMIIASIGASHYFLNKLFVIVKGNRTAFSKYKKVIRVIQLILYALGIMLLIDILLANKYYSNAVLQNDMLYK